MAFNFCVKILVVLLGLEFVRVTITFWTFYLTTVRLLIRVLLFRLWSLF